MTHLMHMRKAAVALMPMDGFTGLPAEPGTVSAVMEDQGVPVRKDSGYFVFWDNGMKHRTLYVDSPVFWKETLPLDMERLERKWQPTLFLWLRPNVRYRYPPGIRLAEGRTDPGTLVRRPVEVSAGLIRLAEPASADGLDGPWEPGLSCAVRPSLLHLAVPGTLYMEGRTLFLRYRGTGGEYATIWEEKSCSQGLYQLDAPLQCSLGDIEDILLVSETYADSSGWYRIPQM